MSTLYIWGTAAPYQVSAMFPECQAAVWVCSSHNSIQVVTANNTNLLEIGSLPVLVTPSGKYEGYRNICNYINNCPPSSIDTVAKINSLDHNLSAAINYLYYIDSKNYEGYTRRQFPKYFPFPMMYNQPLRFYSLAQHQVQTAGLNVNKGGLFSFDVTEYVNGDGDGDGDDNEQVPVSKLHASQLVKKNKAKLELREQKNAIGCANLVKTTLDGFTTFDNSEADILLAAYIKSLTNSDLPDQFLNKVISEYSQYEKVNALIAQYDAKEDVNVRGPQGLETPSLANELRYIVS